MTILEAKKRLAFRGRLRATLLDGNTHSIVNLGKTTCLTDKGHVLQISAIKSFD